MQITDPKPHLDAPKKSKNVQIIKVSVSKDYNERLNQLLSLARKQEPRCRLTKQMVVEFGIEKITDNDVGTLARNNKDHKSLVLEYLKIDKRLSDPSKLISLLQKEISDA